MFCALGCVIQSSAGNGTSPQASRQRRRKSGEGGSAPGQSATSPRQRPARATLAAAQLEGEAAPPRGTRLLSAGRVERAGLRRGQAAPWPAAEPPSPDVRRRWREAWGADPFPSLLWITHPSAQNMSPYARVETVFHARMLEARAALRRAVRDVLGRETPAGARPPDPTTGIYALPEWRELVGPRHAQLDRLWREKGV